ncbi:MULTISPECIES: hypothetical protein [Amycolatopsis]|uniref:Uncharacterized protein n=1 Tax=Amycolatopsis thermalba TaxID=944492 RepID=A0ABY4NUB5_9PSEU|nr:MULTISPECIES: hypothetical protein [Amycolatopsis]OXM72878.1 hypothetical protein CF166_12760 [Amycolatopsis sp. KNN50.9b]UQS23661.1 hypothetical protein L1857_12910 [Amycolatopsis thermalba]
MAVEQHASYADWQRAYGDYYESLPDRPDLACPNCGHHELRLVFVADATERIGYAQFSCGHCGFGIHVSRTWVPDGVEFLPIDTPVEELDARLPDFTLVHPPEDADGDIEEVRF